MNQAKTAGITEWKNTWSANLAGRRTQAEGRFTEALDRLPHAIMAEAPALPDSLYHESRSGTLPDNAKLQVLSAGVAELLSRHNIHVASVQAATLSHGPVNDAAVDAELAVKA